MIKSFLKLLTRCYRLALPYGQLKLFGVLAMIFFNGLLQLVGVTSVFPFFALAADPDRIRISKYGMVFLSFLPPLSDNHLLAVAGIFSIVMLVVASLGSMLSEWLRIRYAYGFAHWLRGSLLTSYASRPYSYFLKRNSTALYQRVLDILTFTQGVLLSLGEILSRIVLVALLVLTVFLVQPMIALGAVVLLGGFYFCVFLWLRPRTRDVSSKLQFLYTEYAKQANQFLHGVKTVMVYGKSEYFIDKSLGYSQQLGKYQSKVPVYSNAPRYLIEPLAFGGLVAIVVVLALNGRGFSDILPNLSVMALAGYRLLPALQSLYVGFVNISANNYTLTQLEEEISGIEAEAESPATQKEEGHDRLGFAHEIQISNLSFGYPGSDTLILNDFNLSIRKNESIGIAGASGSGKSTLVDILLGLHNPVAGSILVDGEKLTLRNMDSWRSLIGYVPQDIYLMDETIAENIAFGIDPTAFDHQLLRAAADGAQILEFIEKELPEGFQTIVGERGVRLSGGQRQRIGLARALYHKPQILILDEATSALDHETEAAVMETIHKLQGSMTMITIAHRLSTLDRCDRIIQLQKSI
jgi:ATP-binding cassette, subfamily B, bacterial PglK